MAELAQRRATRRLRVGVVGVGYFGRFHAANYAALPDVELVAVVDIDPARARAVGAAFGCDAVTDHRQILGAVDAVSIAAPAKAHCAVARDFLAAGTHVLVEKPIALSLADADSMIALAARSGVVLQVGHQERFLLDGIDPGALAPDPRAIACRRAGPASGRGTDCSVVLDVMIHDLDLVHALVTGEADGAATAADARSSADDVRAILKLNGCAIELSASRSQATRERWMRVTGARGGFALDFVARRMTRLGADGADEGTQRLPDDDLLLREIANFVAAVRGREAPRVSGADGRRALATALTIDRRRALAD